MHERVIAYIDGFNLYYGAVKGTQYKWLNVDTLCRRFVASGERLVGINYCTARISARPSDPDAPVRQQVFLRALGTIPNISFHFGHFLSHPVFMPLASSVGTAKTEYVSVLKTEEKGSDVNLASHLLRDAYTDKFSLALVVSNDSDLAEPIRIVRGELGKRVGIICPHRKRPSRVLQTNADFFKTLRPALLRDSQFPDVMSDRHGEFRKPEGW